MFENFPADRLLEVDELDRMLQLPPAGPVSAKPLGDMEEQKSAKRLPGEISKSFSRRFLSKHGWNCFMIEKRSTNHQYQSRGAENKRASIIYNLRENSAGGLDQYLENKDQEMDIIVETNESMAANQFN